VLEIVCLREPFFISQYLSNVLVENLLLDTGLGSTSGATKLLCKQDWHSVVWHLCSLKTNKQKKNPEKLPG